MNPETAVTYTCGQFNLALLPDPFDPFDFSNRPENEAKFNQVVFAVSRYLP